MILVPHLYVLSFLMYYFVCPYRTFYTISLFVIRLLMPGTLDPLCCEGTVLFVFSLVCSPSFCFTCCRVSFNTSAKLQNTIEELLVYFVCLLTSI